MKFSESCAEWEPKVSTTKIILILALRAKNTFLVFVKSLKRGEKRVSIKFAPAHDQGVFWPKVPPPHYHEILARP